jgi:hypothetical protein
MNTIRMTTYTGFQWKSEVGIRCGAHVLVLPARDERGITFRHVFDGFWGIRIACIRIACIRIACSGD